MTQRRLPAIVVLIVLMIGLGWGPAAVPSPAAAVPAAAPTPGTIEELVEGLLKDPISRIVLEIWAGWNKVTGAYNMAGLMYDATELKEIIREAIVKRMPANSSPEDIELELKKVWEEVVTAMTAAEDYSLGYLLTYEQYPELFKELGFPKDRTLLVAAAVNQKRGDHAEQRIWKRLTKALQGTVKSPGLGFGQGGSKQASKALHQAKQGGYSSRDYCADRCQAVVYDDRFPEQNERFEKNSRKAADYLTKNAKKASANQVQTAENLARGSIKKEAEAKREAYLQEAVETQQATADEVKELGRIQDQKEASRRLGLGQSICPPTSLSWGTASGVLAAPQAAGDCSEDDVGGLIRSLAAARERKTGGIDFSSLQLRYVSARPRADGGLPYAYSAQPLAAGYQEDGELGATVIRTAREDLQTWLALDPSTFWVNLSPDQPDRIVDERLGRTNAARVLLEADLQLKRTSAELSDPRTTSGAALWNALKPGDSGDTCLSDRLWIVPRPAQVHEKDDALYVLEAPLEVRMEADYLTGAHADTCPRSDAATEAHNVAVEKRFILPTLNKAVNTAPEYAPLRRTYAARVVAEWIRGKHAAGERTAFDEMIDSGVVPDSQWQDGWRPREVFDTFVKSFEDGEFDVTRTTHEGGRTLTHRYFLGGVEFEKVALQRLSAEQMQTSHSGTPPAVKKSISEPVTLADGSIWLGGTSFTEPVGPVDRVRNWVTDTPGLGKALWAMVLVLALYVVGFRLGRPARRRARS